eukprot:1161976-Pelagomonas_calceolata.AAC.16
MMRDAFKMTHDGKSMSAGHPRAVWEDGQGVSNAAHYAGCKKHGNIHRRPEKGPAYSELAGCSGAFNLLGWPDYWSAESVTAASWYDRHFDLQPTLPGCCIGFSTRLCLLHMSWTHEYASMEVTPHQVYDFGKALKRSMYVGCPVNAVAFLNVAGDILMVDVLSACALGAKKKCASDASIQPVIHQSFSSFIHSSIHSSMSCRADHYLAAVDLCLMLRLARIIRFITLLMSIYAVTFCRPSGSVWSSLSHTSMRTYCMVGEASQRTLTCIIKSLKRASMLHVE